VRVWRLGQVDTNRLVGDQLTLVEEPDLERARFERIPLGRERLPDQAVWLSVAPEDECARIAK
jgi:hypothetical protein